MRKSKTRFVRATLTPVLTVLLSAGLTGTPAAAAGPAPVAGPAAATGSFPSVLPLPNGFSPEGIAIHRGKAYTGSLFNGAIQRIDLRTGVAEQFAAPPGAGRISVGLDVGPSGPMCPSRPPASSTT